MRVYINSRLRNADAVNMILCIMHNAWSHSLPHAKRATFNFN